MADQARRSATPEGGGPLAGAEPETGRPLEDPALADRSNPRWDEPGESEPELDSQPLTNPDGSPNVMPARELPADAKAALPTEPADDGGTEQDQAARPLTPGSVGRDNIREGEGGGTTNPALAEGGDHG